MMSFQISSLTGEHFKPLFGASTEELILRNAVRMVADKKPGFPCRVSLADAEIGEEVVLVHYQHQAAETPYKASHAVYVRANAAEASMRPDEIPEMLRLRVLSLRGFDESGMMRAADLSDGRVLETAIAAMFRDERIAYIHVHFAKAGCYAARVDRA
jgi:hypothetical protein